jgi:ankyrin repeat protein
MIKRGANPNEESPKGLTPLLCMILNEVAAERVDELIAMKADVNMPNKYGITPLMLACRLRDTKMVHVLMKSGASALQKVRLRLFIVSFSF